MDYILVKTDASLNFDVILDNIIGKTGKSGGWLGATYSPVIGGRVELASKGIFTSNFKLNPECFPAALCGFCN